MLQLTFVFLVIFTSLFSSQAGTVISQVNTPDDLDLSGDVIYAVNFGGNGNPNVGGFVFSQSHDYPALTLDITGQGPATWWGAYPGTGDSGLNQLLNGLAYKYPVDTIGINAGGLSVGMPYLLQLVFYEPEEHERHFDIVVEDSQIATAFAALPAQGGVVGKGGSVLKYDFTATDPVLNITLVPYINAVGLSGFIVTQVPEPATLLLLGLGGLLIRRRSVP